MQVATENHPLLINKVEPHHPCLERGGNIDEDGRKYLLLIMVS
jgi:hypothetical protein